MIQNNESVMLAIAPRTFTAQDLNGDEKVVLAMEMYTNRIVEYVSKYFVKLEGKVDAIVFTAGVGENGREARADILGRLLPLGIKVDAEVNDTIASYKDKSEGIISAEDSSVAVCVVPTNEELMIIKDTYELVK
mgnify:CR=1 FL=1